MRTTMLAALFVLASTAVFAADPPTSSARKQAPASAGQPHEVGRLTSLPGPVAKIAFALDGNRLIVETGVEQPRGPQGQLIMISGPNVTAAHYVLWALSPRKVSKVRTRGVAEVCMPSPDAKTLAVWEYDGRIRRREWEFCDLASQRKVPRPNVWKWLNGEMGPLAFSPDGKVAAALFSDHKNLGLFDVATGKEFSRMAMPGKDSPLGVVFSGNGKLLAVPLASSRSLAIYEVASGKVLRQFDKFAQGSVLALTADGKTLALGNPKSAEVSLWDTGTGEQTGSWKGHTHGVGDLVFSANDKVLFAGSGDKMVFAWDPITDREIGRFHAHQSAVTVLALSPDGHTLATGGTDKAVHLWDIRGLTSPGQR